MNPNELYPHNLEAYNKIMKSFKTKRKAAIVHATGTGKSYIIASVADNFKKVLVVAPNDIVLGETRKVCHSGTDFMTYQYICFNYDKVDNDYELIVLDEFHRSGAEEWGAAVSMVVEANKKAKVLGTSANDIRYMDGLRDMAEEMFDGNVVSRITLSDAITRKLLPTPKYVCAVYNIDDNVKDIRERILSSNKDCKDKDLRKLEQINSNWQNSNGMVQIVKKYVPSDCKRIITFCSNIESVYAIEELLSQWFTDAGFEKLKFYRITSGESNYEANMKKFVSNDFDGLKIAISVNMLNEGAHIDGVEGVIMLRSTMSRIIAEQQIGRCLTANNVCKTPFVLDCVNNVYYFDNKYGSKIEEPINNPNTRKRKNKEKKHIQFAFDIIDESRDIREFLIDLKNKYSFHLWTREELEVIAKKYNTPYEWEKKDNNSYQSARRKDYFLEITSHMNRRNKYNYTREELEAEAKKYKTLAEWNRCDKNSYMAAMSKPYFKEITPHIKKRKKRWTREELEVEAKKYKTKKEWQKADVGSYNSAVKKPYYNELTSHMIVINHMWTRDELETEAKKYKTSFEWQKADMSTYRTAARKSYYKEITLHFKKIKKWTREKLESEAKKYKTKIEWINSDVNSYQVAIKKSYYKEITSHMTKHYERKCNRNKGQD